MSDQTDLAALLPWCSPVGGVALPIVQRWCDTHHRTLDYCRDEASEINVMLAAGVRVTGGDLLALADEWCDRTAPDDVARLNVRGFAVWANLRAGVRVTGDAGEPLDGVDCDWDDNGKCRCRLAGDAGRDVERLAMAIRMNGYEIRPHRGEWVRPADAAAAIAREYAALATEEKP